MGLVFGSEPSLDHVGPMGRYSEDVAAALQAVAGYDGLDPRQSRDVPDGIDVLSRLGDGVTGIRIAVMAEGFADRIERAVRDGVREALEVLRRAGADVSRSHSGTSGGQRPGHRTQHGRRLGHQEHRNTWRLGEDVLPGVCDRRGGPNVAAVQRTVSELGSSACYLKDGRGPGSRTLEPGPTAAIQLTVLWWMDGRTGRFQSVCEPAPREPRRTQSGLPESPSGG